MTEHPNCTLFLCLGSESLQALFPYVAQCVANDMEGGRTLLELENLRNGIRSALQRYNIEVDP